MRRSLRHSGRLLQVVAVVCACVALRAVAGPVWQTNGAPVCAVSGVQETPNLASLGADGMIVVWADRRSEEYDIYAQRMDARGAEVWAAGGVAICTATYDQQFPAVVPDGSGGAIVVWQDGRLGDDGLEIYAQRVRANGTTVWQADGVPVCTHLAGLTDPPTAFSHVVTSGGSGGAIVAWRDTRTDPVIGNTEIYAQRLDSNGAPLWTLDGVKLLGFGAQKWATRNPVIVPDGSAGAVVLWQDARNAQASANDLYAQRVTAAGTVQWAVNGVVVCNAASDQGYPGIVSLGGSAVVVVWEDRRSGNYDIYAQKLDAVGAAQWNANGRLVCDSANDQRTPRVVGDGAVGVITAWTDKRASSVYTDIYAQKLDANGAPVWNSGGVAVCLAAGSQTRIRMSAGDAGSALLSWMDTRGEATTAVYDLYSQTLDANGSLRWMAEGLPFAALAGTSQRMQQATGDGMGGLYVVWEDDRNAGDWDIYAQRLSPHTPVSGIVESKGRPDGMLISLPARVVTAAFDGYFYIQEPDRSAGIKIVSPEAVSPGDLVTVAGTIQTDSERYISASFVSKITAP